ncbi:hypothetical protein GLOIN_2v1475138 [Rhizophagus irregularis DAOM 181602=DAOM 197198]|nr:hypothetical protein GLOIN_2v1475138 [Rhizophagus irregularis DAOM 181602=DAOM 197198]
MHSYNPLEKADTIAIIIQKLPLEVLDKLCWINISEEFIERETEIAKKQVEIERYILHNGMLEGQEKEIVKYNIRQIAKNVVPWWDVDKWEESEFLGFIKKDTYGGFAPKEYNRPFGFGIKQFINKILYYDDETLYFVENDPI